MNITQILTDPRVPESWKTEIRNETEFGVKALKQLKKLKTLSASIRRAVRDAEDHPCVPCKAKE